MQCENGHEMREVAQRTLTEIEEEVVYRKQKIKHFNREGSEYWAEVEVPDLVEKKVSYAIVDYRCDQCGAAASIRRDASPAG